MKHRFALFRRSLVMRLWRIICITVVPLILGTLVLTGLFLGNLWEEQKEENKAKVILKVGEMDELDGM